MTLYINIGEKIFTTGRSPRALYLTYDFNLTMLEKLLTLKTRYYHPNLDMWEVPFGDLEIVQYTFADYDIVTNNDKIQKIVDKYKESISTIVDSETVDTYVFKTKPFDHQLEGFLYGQEHDRFLLADDQGLGKTKQVIDIAVNRANKIKHCLIICGENSLKWNWLEEIEMHSDETACVIGSYVNRKERLVQGGMDKKLEYLDSEFDDFFLITNMESLRNKLLLQKLEDLIGNGEISMVAIDEIHKMKSPSSAVGKAIHKLPSYYRIGLSGTPLITNVLDLYNILKWLGEENGTLTNFKYNYCIFGGFGNREIVGYKNMADLRARMSKIQLRRLKSEVLDLPPKIHQNIYVELVGKQRKLYRLIEAELIDHINDVMLSTNPLAKLTRLRQVTSAPAILEESIGYGAKIDRLVEIVDEVTAQGHKVLIYSNWTKVIRQAEKALAKHKPLLYTGEQKDEVRSKNKRIFQTDDNKQVIMGTVGAMGTGITLNKGSYVMFLDEPWSPQDKMQAEDRAHRIGTQNTVNVLTFVTKDSVDEYIQEIIYKKSALSSYLVDGEIKSNTKLIVNALLGL
jgi:SNF2 family DNA or RNA helicase